MKPEEWLSFLKSWFSEEFGINTAVLLMLILFAYITYLIATRIFVRLLRGFLVRSRVNWADELIEAKLFSTAARIVPFFFLYTALPYTSLPEVWWQRPVLGVLIILIALFIDRGISFALLLYEQKPIARRKPVRGYAQIIKIFMYFLMIVFFISALIGQSPIYFFSGLGAMTAVILLIFKDTILGFVAGLQLSFNNLVQVGDWLSLPQFGADGEVVEISLHTLKIQNWDKSISMVPMHQMMNNSFVNWRGMIESGGRRIKRSLLIDMADIAFLDEEAIFRLRQIPLLRKYIDQKIVEIRQNFETILIPSDKTLEKIGDNLSEEEKEKDILWSRQRKLTNVGCFRRYIQNYLQNHPEIRNDMTFLVRQMTPSEKGLPIEIYVFGNDVEWGNFERLQADIFDHLLASVSDFNLRIYQQPSGYDLRNLHVS